MTHITNNIEEASMRSKFDDTATASGEIVIEMGFRDRVYQGDV
jgi:hypothetical protein